VQKSLAMGFIKRDFSLPGTELTLWILGEERSAKVVRGCLYDPEGKRLKS
jgi:dimethylglycine dehydrogenase